MAPQSSTVLEGEWLTAAQAQARLRVSHTRFYQLVRDGRIVYQEAPYGRLYQGQSVDALRAELDATPWKKTDAQPDAADDDDTAPPADDVAAEGA